MDKIINRIVEYRKIRGITQQEIASKLGIAQVNYSKIESGKTSLTVDRLLNIARILKVDLITLLFPEFDNVKYFQGLQEENSRLKKINDLLIEQIDNKNTFLGLIYERFPETRELIEARKRYEDLEGLGLQKKKDY